MSTRAYVAGGAVLGLLTWFFWPKKEESKTSEIQFDVIDHTAIVGLPNVGNIRVFDNDTARTAMENLAGAYTYEVVENPLVGVKGIRAVRAGSQPQKGFRAFDWIAQALSDGFYVISNARAGAGPWDQTLGNNGIFAVQAAELTHPDIVNDWSTLVGPESAPAFQKLAAMSTDELLKALYASA